MTLTAPSTFRRSSEAPDADRQAAVEEARLRKQRDDQAFEEIGFSAAAASVHVRRATMDEVFFDGKAYDLEGIA